MKIWDKPIEWKHFVFIEKLRWYAKKDNKIKNVFADKFLIKEILAELNLPNLKYAKVVTHVQPIEQTLPLKCLVTIDEILAEKEEKVTMDDINDLMYESETTDQFWNLLEENHNIIKEPDSEEKKNNIFVVKFNLGWNIMLFCKNNKIIKLVSDSKEFNCDPSQILPWKNYTLSNYKKNTPPKFFIEEFIGYNLKVYEVYCIYGKPIVLSVYYETNECYENNYLIIEEEVTDEFDNELQMFSVELIENAHLMEGAKKLNFEVDQHICKQMCNYAKEFSRFLSLLGLIFTIPMEIFIFRNVHSNQVP